ncbi:unnamed protein product [Periconia digitata]|uniref:N-acetyltransferase domain-containing protein n=1 Tax=Periconia digitata TaxID=1303443 RepID=A0A9W4UFP6_9PLEO|nr:unnamed protein product [Periconia digitata]
MASPSVRVHEARFPHDAQTVATLFRAYAEWLNVDLTFQSFQTELAQLPGKYARESGGTLLLAYQPPTTASAATSDNRADVGSEAAGALGQATSSPPPASLGNCIGCVAFRRFGSEDVCELKRLYIVPEARGLGAGGVLVAKALEMAREMGYKEMLLDTLASMVAARKLYVRFGFRETDSYYDNPLDDVVYYRAVL